MSIDPLACASPSWLVGTCPVHSGAAWWSTMPPVCTCDAFAEPALTLTTKPPPLLGTLQDMLKPRLCPPRSRLSTRPRASK